MEGEGCIHAPGAAAEQALLHDENGYDLSLLVDPKAGQPYACHECGRLPKQPMEARALEESDSDEEKDLVIYCGKCAKKGYVTNRVIRKLIGRLAIECRVK